MTNPGPPHGPDGRPGQQPWASQPAQQPWGQPPAAGSKGGAGRLIAGIAIGLVAAVIVGAVLMFTKVIGFGSDSDVAVDGTAIALPAELAGYRDRADAVADKSEERGTEEQQRLQKTYDLTTQWYQQAFDGAGVGVRTYSDDELTFFPTVIAVRAASPGLFTGPVVDRTIMKMEAGPGMYDRVVEGDVECLSTSSVAVIEGKEVDPEDQLTTVCRRANDTVTVYVHASAKGPAGQQQMVEVTNAAFEAATGAVG